MHKPNSPLHLPCHHLIVRAIKKDPAAGELFGMKPKKSRSVKPSEVASAAPSRTSEKLVSLPESTPEAGAPPLFPVTPILLEGDEFTSAGAPGLGQKFIAGAPALLRTEPPEVIELPEAYGTGRLFLMP